MTIFSAKAIGQQIHMNIPADLLEHANKSFEGLRWNADLGVYEIHNTPMVFIECEKFIRQFLSQEDARLATRELHHSMIEAALSGQFSNNKDELEASRLAVEPKVLSSAQTAEIAPELNEMITFLGTKMQEHGFEVSGLCIPPKVLHFLRMPVDVPVFLCCLPAAFESSIASVACQNPTPRYLYKIDMSASIATYCWNITQEANVPTILSIELSVFEHFYGNRTGKHKDLQAAHVIFSAGDTIVFGGHIRDKVDADEVAKFLAATPLQDDYTEEQVAAAEQHAAVVGPTPFYGNFYQGDSMKLAFVPIFGDEKHFQPCD